MKFLLEIILIGDLGRPCPPPPKPNHYVFCQRSPALCPSADDGGGEERVCILRVQFMYSLFKGVPGALSWNGNLKIKNAEKAIYHMFRLTNSLCFYFSLISFVIFFSAIL